MSGIWLRSSQRLATTASRCGKRRYDCINLKAAKALTGVMSAVVLSGQLPAVSPRERQ